MLSSRALAIVTGGAGGLGALLADRLAETYDVVVVDRAAQESPHHVVTGDLSDQREVPRLVDSLSRLGRIGVLVNNAGGWTSGEQYPAGDATGWGATLDQPCARRCC